MSQASISVFTSPHLAAVILALRGMDKELSAQIRKATRSVGQEEWKRALAQESTTRLENRVLVDSARVTVSNQNVLLKSGQLSKKMRGGAKVFELTPHVEFGANTGHVGKATSTTGTQFKRHTRAQFKPRNRKGYVVYPAVAEFIPRMAALWVQTTVRTFHEALEKR